MEIVECEVLQEIIEWPEPTSSCHLELINFHCYRLSSLQFMKLLDTWREATIDEHYHLRYTDIIGILRTRTVYC